MGKPGLPPRPTRDADKISASWINRLLDCVEYAMTHPAGDGMTILQSGGILRALQRTRGGGGGGGGGACFPCKVVSQSGAFYLVEKYEDGIDAASTGEAKVYVLGLNFADTLPAGTWIVASESQIGTTGGGNVP